MKTHDGVGRLVAIARRNRRMDTVYTRLSHDACAEYSAMWRHRTLKRLEHGRELVRCLAIMRTWPRTPPYFFGRVVNRNDPTDPFTSIAVAALDTFASETASCMRASSHCTSARQTVLEHRSVRGLVATGLGGMTVAVLDVCFVWPSRALLARGWPNGAVGVTDLTHDAPCACTRYL